MPTATSMGVDRTQDDVRRLSYSYMAAGIVERPDAAEIDPRLAGLHALWDARRPRGQGFAPLARLDPMGLPRALLPFVMLAEPVRGDFRFRLVGTYVVARGGADVTGRLLSHVGYPPEVERPLRQSLATCLARGVPVLARFDAAWLGRDRGELRALFLPLSEGGEVPDLVLGSLVMATPPA